MGWCLRIFLAMAGLLVLQTKAGSYPAPVDFSGKLLRWDIDRSSPPITYAIKAERSEDAIFYEDAVEDSAVLWNRVPESYFRFKRIQDQDAADITVHLENALDGASFSAGYTKFDERAEDNSPVHCSVHVLVGESSYTAIAKTILHELGHCIGLGHSLVPESIMSYDLKSNAFALDMDDQAAIARLYPADGSEPKLPPGCATGSHVAHGPQTRTFLLILMFLPPFLIQLGPPHRRRRRLGH